MAESGEIRDAYMDLQPDAWRYKTGSGYSVTEGMEYELFTEKFRNLYKEIQEKERQYTETVKTNIFLGDMLIQAEDERIKENMFIETKKVNRKESLNTGILQQEIFVGIGFIILLIFILTGLTFRRKKKTKHT